jgi:hypothetical protein
MQQPWQSLDGSIPSTVPQISTIFALQSWLKLGRASTLPNHGNTIILVGASICVKTLTETEKTEM